MQASPNPFIAAPISGSERMLAASATPTDADKSIGNHFFAIRNHSSVKCTRGISPWHFCPRGEVPYDNSKQEFRRWSAQPDTDHFFYSMYEGSNPHFRISSDNPAYRMHGLVVDFDAEIATGDWESLVQRCSPDFRPMWGSLTKSGNARLVWLFEAPVFVFEKAAHKAFVDRVSKELRLERLLPGLDQAALHDVAKTYEVGHTWRRISDYVISSSTLQHWLYKAAEKANYKQTSEVMIPIEVIADEVEKRFPGRWAGAFVVGARGCRFWDSMAENDTAAIVHDTGMQCFTGAEPFVSWRQIFGPRFVDAYAENQIATATQDIWFDGREYWMKCGEVYERVSRESVRLHLKVACGLSPTHLFGQPGSEVDQALYFIERNNRVSSATPIVHRKPGVHARNGERILNTSRVKALQPSEGPQAWGEDFPFVAKLLDSMFPPQQDVKPLEFLLAWLRHAYAGAVQWNPRRGQALFIAGPVGKGKSLMSREIIGPILGGTIECTSILLGETSFNGPAYNMPVWTVDDASPGRDPRVHAKFSNNIKKMVANHSFEFMAKFRDQASVEWSGRIVVTLNDDPESLRMLPDAEISILDKLMLFRISDHGLEFPENVQEVIGRELPFFARWVLDWTPPDYLRGSTRFGVREFHDPSLLAEARDAGSSAEFRQLIGLFRQSYFDRAADDCWEGSAAQLIMVMNVDPRLADLLRSMRLSPVQVGRELSKLKAMGYSITPRRSGGDTLWRINRKDGFQLPVGDGSDRAAA